MKWLALLALAGCSFPTPSAGYACETTLDCESGRVCSSGYCVLPIDETPIPDAPETPIDTPENVCTMFPSRHFDACMIPAPMGGLVLDLPGEYVYNTMATTLTDPNGVASIPVNQVIPSGRLISVDALSIAAGTTLRVIGDRPLIVASWSTITVDGAIDASSDATGRGAGANPADCSVHAAIAGENDDAGGAGGGGGGFQGAGGTGGEGGAGATGGNGGVAVAAPLLLGGCAGARGGTGDTPGGSGGDGGGAVQLTARTGVMITGTVHAGGSGGDPATTNGGNDADGGGGGGGSGGMIGLEAPDVTVASGATLAANGGGGGEGINDGPGGRGSDGAPAATRASGGNGGDGGNGGLGSGGPALAGGNGADDSENGAGGAGGGAGYVVIFGASTTLGPGAVISPMASAP